MKKYLFHSRSATEQAQFYTRNNESLTLILVIYIYLFYIIISGGLFIGGPFGPPFVSTLSSRLMGIVVELRSSGLP